MPATVTLPRAQESSIGRLGDVIFASAADYAEKRRADEREARLRAQRLADVESDRMYVRGENERQYERGRTNQLTDIKDARGYEQEIYTRNVGDKRGDVEDERTWQLMAANWERQIKDSPAGIEQAQARLNQLANERQQIRGQMGALEKTLGEAEPQPDLNKVTAEAIKRAKAAIPKAKFYQDQQTVPTQAAIDAQIPTVMEEERGRLNAAWERQRRDAQIQYPTLAAMLQNVGAESNVITNVFRRVGIAAPTAPAEGAPADGRGAMRNLSEPGLAPAVPALATAQQAFASAVRQQVQKPNSAPASPPAAAPSPLAEPAQVAPPSVPAAQPAAPSNWDRMRVMEPGYNPLTMLTGQTPDRLAETGALNQQRRTQNAAGLVIGEIDPAIEANGLRTQLSRIADKNSVTAQTIMNRLRQLEQSLAQKMTRSAQLIEPANTFIESAPVAARRGLSARFTDPGY